MRPEQASFWRDAEEMRLTRLAVALGAPDFGGPLSAHELQLISAASNLPSPPQRTLRCAIAEIRSGLDPLGDILLAARDPSERRLLGQVFTPTSIVEPMIQWLLNEAPGRVVDAGCGSGRFSLAVARQSNSSILALDTDPLSTLTTRAGLACLRNKRAVVLHADYTTAKLPAFEGKTAFIGNPPYLRHHNLTAAAKTWAQRAAARIGVPISGLAGLHAYFFLATALHGRSGDCGCFVTSSEWLDVNYGEVIRRLLVDGLGGRAIHVLTPMSTPFGNTATTAAVTCFEIGSRPKSIRIRMVKDAADLSPLTNGRPISRERLTAARRWLPLIRSKPAIPDGYVDLGELCRVHRGTVTGSNATWVVPPNGEPVVPDRYQFASVTKARELIQAGDDLKRIEGLRRVIDLPIDLDELDPSELKTVERFLKLAKASGAADGYVAQNRRAWWSVGLRTPAPILATYMARGKPTFVRNLAAARHINIAHGIYPRTHLSNIAVERLVKALRNAASIGLGRVYAGGLVKFEPSEMERIPVPSLDLLMAE